MAVHRYDPVDVDTDTLRPLSRAEIAERMSEMAADVAVTVAAENGASRHADPSEPRWIRPADFVRRMRPYLVYN